MQKIITEAAPPELGRWAATLEAALRPQIRQLIESILEEEVEEAVMARRGGNWGQTGRYLGRRLLSGRDLLHPNVSLFPRNFRS